MVLLLKGYPNKEVVLVVEDEFLVCLHAVHLVEEAG